MASEYLKKKYQDVKPDEKRELTPAEKRKNWWYYHRGHVAIGVILALIAADLVWSFLGRGEPKPDYQIAYVGSGSLPNDTAAAIETAFAGLGEDLNGDGQVVVRLRQYVSYADGDPSAAAAVEVQLMADVMEQESFLFLLEEPERFQRNYHTLSRLDGALPEEGDDSTADSVLAWGQCPALTGLELGSYSFDYPGGTASGSSQELLSPLFIGRRGFWGEEEETLKAGYASLWAKITEGAVS